MTDILNFLFDLVQNMNPILVFIQIPLAIAAGLTVIWILLKLFFLARDINRKVSEKQDKKEEQVKTKEKNKRAKKTEKKGS